MKITSIALSYVLLALAAGSTAQAAETIDTLLDQAMAGAHRSDSDRARDIYRHPKETLMFFGLEPDMSVVEIWPSAGWYTAILAPALKPHGVLYAAGFAMTAQRTPDWREDVQTDFATMLESNPQAYDHVVVTELSVPERTTIAPPGRADLVVTFRNVHNWMNGDYAADMFRIMARALKPGGVLGVVEHRANPATTIDEMKQSGYVTEAYVIALAEEAGLVLEARSEINANPRDSKQHPAGVWSLPPSLRYCRSLPAGAQQNSCQAEYMAIGESDRMTLRFRKR